MDTARTMPARFPLQEGSWLGENGKAPGRCAGGAEGQAKLSPLDVGSALSGVWLSLDLVTMTGQHQGITAMPKISRRA